MRRRKSRGLGSSTEMHKKTAQDVQKYVMSNLKHAEKYVQDGRCQSALMNLVGAAEDAGSVLTHMYAAGGKKVLPGFARKASIQIAAVRNAIAQSCFAPGKLSGLRRRRRARR